MTTLLREDKDPVSGGAGPGTAAPRLDGIAVLTDLSEAEPFWRRLEQAGTATPFQRFDWVSAWLRHAGAEEGASPLIVVGRDSAGEPLFVWPLARTRRGPLTVGLIPGGKHANFGGGLWQRDYAATLTARDLWAIRARLAPLARGVDALLLSRQPQAWGGLANPFRLLPHRPSAHVAARLTLGAPGEEVLTRQLSSSMRGRLRQKERKLAPLAGYRYLHATSADDVARILAAFFEQKAAYFATRAVENDFARPGVAAFVRAACLQGLASGAPVIELDALEGAGRILALFGGTLDGQRYCGMFTSYENGDAARHSPGLILLSHLVRHCADRGLAGFDLGIGEDSYKQLFCSEPEPLFDCVLPLSARGRLTAAALRARAVLRRALGALPARRQKREPRPSSADGEAAVPPTSKTSV